jgi:hypothetical protein
LNWSRLKGNLIIVSHDHPNLPTTANRLYRSSQYDTSGTISKGINRNARRIISTGCNGNRVH